ncbi:hypothetical protein Tco_0226385 [Tanacetum coccineum]
MEALKEMPNCSRHLKDLLKNDSKTEEASKTEMTERCPTLLKNTMPTREKDPGNFTLPCLIDRVFFRNSLVDLGASINIMSHSTFTNLGLGE